MKKLICLFLLALALPMAVFAKFYVKINPKVETDYDQHTYGVGSVFCNSDKDGLKLSELWLSPGSKFIDKVAVIQNSLATHYSFNYYDATEKRTRTQIIGVAIGDPLNSNEPGEIKVSLTPNANAADGKWCVRGIEIYAMNTSESTKVSLTIDDVKIYCSKQREWEYLTADFGDEGRRMDSFSLIVNKNVIGLSTIKIYIEPELDAEDAGFNTYADAGNEIHFPLPCESKYIVENGVGLAILDATSTLKTEGSFDPTSGVYSVADLPIGHYYACYYTKSQKVNSQKREEEDAATLAALTIAHGKHFVVQPVLPADFSINGAQRDGDVVYIPEQYNPKGESASYTWKNAILSDVKADAVYWKTTLENPLTVKPDYNKAMAISCNAIASSPIISGAACYRQSDSYVSEIPDGFAKYSDAGIRLTGGNTLYLILEKDGVLSEANKINYLKNGSTSLVEAIEDCTQSVRYYQLDGSPADLKTAPKGAMLIRALPDGTSSIIVL